MKSIALLQKIKKKEHQLYLFHGEETFLKEEALRQLLSAYETKLPEFNIDVLRDWGIRELEVSCETLPFMDDKRIVIAKSSKFSENISEKELANLEELLKNISDTTVLVLYEGKKLDTRKTYYKMAAKYCIVGEFELLQEWEAAQWVEKQIAENNKTISSDDARYLVTLVGRELSLLHNELCKLFDYCAGFIARKDIDYIVTPSVEYNVFWVLDCLDQGKAEGWKEIKTLMENEEIPKIIGAMAARFRMMFQCKAYLNEGYKENQILQKAGDSYGVRQALNGCRRFSLEMLENAMDLLAAADYDMKNGIRKDRQALQDVVLNIYDGNKECVQKRER